MIFAELSPWGIEARCQAVSSGSTVDTAEQQHLQSHCNPVCFARIGQCAIGFAVCTLPLLLAINLTILNHSEPWKSAWSVLHVVRLSQGQRKAKLSMAVLNTHSGRAVVIQHIPTPMTFDAWELVTWKNVMNLHPQRCLNVHVSMSPHYSFVCWSMAKCRRWLVQLNMVR